MGFFGDMIGMAARGAGISARKERIKREIETLRVQSEQELEEHNAAYERFIASEKTAYLSNKEHYIVTYMFTKVMLEEAMSQRDFSFLDQMPEEYRNGEVFRRNLAEVENEYYPFLANTYKDGEISAPSMISALKDLCYFKELREEVQEIIGAEPFLADEAVASQSVFTDCDDISAMMQRVREFNITDADAMQDFRSFADGITEWENGNFKSAVRNWLFGNYKKEDFDRIKIALLHFAQDKDQDMAAVGLYDSYKKICRRTFGLSTVKNVDGSEKVVLYPSVDMVIAEVFRHFHSGTVDQYDDTLIDWLDNCGKRVDGEQLNVLQNIFSYLNAFKQEAIVLEYMVKNNLARTTEQDQRLKFLRSNGTDGVVNTLSFNVLNVQANDDELLYDHRFANWKAQEIQQYFNNLTLTRKKQLFNMVIDEWQKDVVVQGIKWNNEQVMQLISNEIHRNFGDTYEICLINSGAAVEDWIDVIPTIYIRAKDTSVRNAELTFLVEGEQITHSIVHLTIMVLLSPKNHANETLENEVLCKKVIAAKEKHNPRMDTFISTVKNILISQLETWMNLYNDGQEIY